LHYEGGEINFYIILCYLFDKFINNFISGFCQMLNLVYPIESNSDRVIFEGRGKLWFEIFFLDEFFVYFSSKGRNSEFQEKGFHQSILQKESVKKIYYFRKLRE